MNDKHSHVMGGSTAQQRRNCPGSLQLEQGMPEPPDSEYAGEGSMLHAAQELIVTEDPTDMGSAEALYQQLIGQDLGFTGHVITPELINNKTRPATEAFYGLVSEYGIYDWFLEQRVSLEEVIKGAYGTLDVMGKDNQKRLHFIDYKFGDGIDIAVTANDGLAFYAASALYDTDPEIMDFCSDISDEILFHIIQPRVGNDNVIKTWKTNIVWVDDWLDQSVAAIEKATSADPPLKPGEWCRWCKAKATCPALNDVAENFLSKKPESMDSVSLAAALQQAFLLKPRIAAVFELAQNEMEAGAAIPGFKLVQKLPRRQWRNEEDAEKRMKSARLRKAEMYQLKLITPTQLEKLKPKLYDRIADEFVIKHSSGLTVVPDDDKRPAVTGSMQLLANALPDQQ